MDKYLALDFQAHKYEHLENQLALVAWLLNDLLSFFKSLKSSSPQNFEELHALEVTKLDIKRMFRFLEQNSEWDVSMNPEEILQESLE